MGNLLSIVFGENDAPAAQTKAPQVKAPQVKAPQVKAPQTKAPQVKAPQVVAPVTEVPPVSQTGVAMQTNKNRQKYARRAEWAEPIDVSKLVPFSIYGAASKTTDRKIQPAAIQHERTELRMDVEGVSMDDGAPVIVWPKNGGLNQTITVWVLEDWERMGKYGYMVLRFEHSEKYLAFDDYGNGIQSSSPDPLEFLDIRGSNRNVFRHLPTDTFVSADMVQGAQLMLSAEPASVEAATPNQLWFVQIESENIATGGQTTYRTSTVQTAMATPMPLSQQGALTSNKNLLLFGAGVVLLGATGYVFMKRSKARQQFQTIV